MVGGNNYRKSQFNLAVQGVRQPGSSFKPFVLATALREGISPATHFESKPQTINLGDKYWVVGNYDNSYLGSIDLERATIESDNAVYAQLTQLVGSKHVAETAKRMGIRSKLDGYFAIGLGAEAVNPLELARAYGTLAYGGRRVDGAMFGNKPRVISKVTERGRTRYNAPTTFEALTSTGGGDHATSALQKAVQLGTGKRADLSDRPVAGKTGTTENYGDAWFVGYTPQLAVAVWVGYPTTLKPMLTEFHGEAVTGGSFPALIWKSFVEKALKGEEAAGLPVSEHVPYAAPKLVTRRGNKLLLDNGLCKSRQEVVYFADGPVADGQLPGERGRGARRAAADRSRGADPRRGTAAHAQAVYAPAAPRQRVGVVVDQRPKTGYLSSYDQLLLVVSKATQGVIPKLVGRSVDDARLRLKKLKIEPRIQLWRSRNETPGDGARSSAPRRRRRRSRREGRARRRWWRSARQRPAEEPRPGTAVTPRPLVATLIPIAAR